jgi:hypothetical protein
MSSGAHDEQPRGGPGAILLDFRAASMINAYWCCLPNTHSLDPRSQ